MDNQTNYANALCRKINALRKEQGFTQDSLADKLNISFQAVSKWETGQSCPDITMLPLLADIFGVTVDALFAIERPAPVPEVAPDDVPIPNAPYAFSDSPIDWADDGKLRAVVFQGRKRLTQPCEEAGKFTLELHGDIRDIEARMNLVCNGNVEGNVTVMGNVDGNVSANGSVTAGCDIGGNVDTNGAVSCGGNIGGGVDTNGSVTCNKIEGDVDTNRNVTCNIIKGNVQAETVKCEKIEGTVCADDSCGCSNPSNISNDFPDDGKLRAVVFRGNRQLTDPIEEAGKFTLELHGDVCDVEAYMNLVCGNVEGDVKASGGIQCGCVGGDIIASGGMQCGDVEGDVTAQEGDVTCGSVEGDVHAKTVKCDEIHGDVHMENH